KQILDQAGVIDRNGDGIRELPDGTPLKITYLVRSGATVREIVATLFISNLKTLGFDVDYKIMTATAIQSLIEAGTGWDIIDPAGTIPIDWTTPWYTYYNKLHSSQIPFNNNAWYSNPEMEKWIGLLGSPFEEERLYAASKVQELLYRDIPYIVYSRAGSWYQIRYDRWIGWPNASNPWWWPVASSSDTSYPLLFGLASRVKGERPVVPWWTKPIEQGGLLIPVETLWDQISQILRPRPTPTIVPTTVSTTTSVTTHVTTPKPTLTTIPTTTPETTTIISLTTAPETTRIMQTVTYTLRSIAEKLVTQTSVFTQTLITREVNWVITIILAIILLAVGSAIGYIIKK
ncbi:MAG: ABC transporter substrate-binding protein, partial [Ignisphaera sp.]